MRDYKSLIYQWIKPLRKVKEFQEIAKVEDIEFLRLYGLSERALSNMFIEYADEEGISRLEKITGIYPDINDTLDARRARLYLYWNDKEPYTEEELRNRLITVCGDLSGFDIIPDYPNYAIEILTRVGGYGVFDEITSMLDYFLPANLELNLHNELEEESSSNVSLAVGSAMCMSYEITNDVNADYSQALRVAPGMVAAEAMVSEITNDIEGAYSSDIPVRGGIAAAGAFDLTVTNDINVSKTIEGTDHNMGGMVSTSMVINA